MKFFRSPKVLRWSATVALIAVVGSLFLNVVTVQ